MQVFLPQRRGYGWQATKAKENATPKHKASKNDAQLNRGFLLWGRIFDKKLSPGSAFILPNLETAFEEFSEDVIGMDEIAVGKDGPRLIAPISGCLVVTAFSRGKIGAVLHISPRHWV